MQYAVIFVFITFIFSFVNVNVAFALLNGSILFRFQDRYDISFPIFLTLVVCIIMGIFSNRDKLSKNIFLQDKYILYMLGFSMLGLLIMAPSSLIGETREYLSSLLFYYFATRLITDSNRLKIHIVVISSVTLYLGYEAYSSAMADPDSMFWARDEYGRILTERRLQGLGYYENANEFGSLMLWPVPLLFALFLNVKSKIIKVISMLAISFLVLIMFKSMSRTVMATFFFMMVMWGLLATGDGKIVKKIITGIVSVVLLVTLLSYLPGPIANRINSITNYENDASFQGRTRSWEQGLKMVTWYPILGIGKGQWLEYHGLMPHNTYVQILAEMAFLGLYFFLRIIYINYKSLFRCIYESEISKEDKRYIIAITVTFSGYLIYIFFGNQGYSSWTYYYLGLGASSVNFFNKDSIKS